MAHQVFPSTTSYRARRAEVSGNRPPEHGLPSPCVVSAESALCKFAARRVSEENWSSIAPRSRVGLPEWRELRTRTSGLQPDSDTDGNVVCGDSANTLVQFACSGDTDSKAQRCRAKSLTYS